MISVSFVKDRASLNYRFSVSHCERINVDKRLMLAPLAAGQIPTASLESGSLQDDSTLTCASPRPAGTVLCILYMQYAQGGTYVGGRRGGRSANGAPSIMLTFSTISRSYSSNIKSQRAYRPIGIARASTDQEFSQRQKGGLQSSLWKLSSQFPSPIEKTLTQSGHRVYWLSTSRTILTAWHGLSTKHCWIDPSQRQL
jgi:hypothetical protein